VKKKKKRGNKRENKKEVPPLPRHAVFNRMEGKKKRCREGTDVHFLFFFHFLTFTIFGRGGGGKRCLLGTKEVVPVSKSLSSCGQAGGEEKTAKFPLPLLPKSQPLKEREATNAVSFFGTYFSGRVRGGRGGK